jgi:lantibiotic modifying enzyme
LPLRCGLDSVEAVLYRAEAFEPLTERPWDDAQVRAEIREIVADADRAWSPGLLWPAHEWDGWASPLPLKTLYVGAAGVVWALDRLRARGHAETELDLKAVARRALEAWRARPGVLTTLELPAPAGASLFMGESGILTVLCRLDPDRCLADDLYRRVRENARSVACDLMWGSPGTMLAAREMSKATGDDRWDEAWRSSASALLEARDADGCWTQRLHGHAYRGLGPAHGVTGNVLALLGGEELLPADVSNALGRDTAGLLTRTAVVEDGCANWPGTADAGLIADDGQIRVQWDCGAPGIVATAASYLDEELVIAGAELTWQAGPHGSEKGSGICHGTAGNGYALLGAFERTGDEQWLVRARSFALQALAQARQARESHGRGRYSLWTGDVGVALYAADCLEGRGRYPVLSGWV